MNPSRNLSGPQFRGKGLGSCLDRKEELAVQFNRRLEWLGGLVGKGEGDAHHHEENDRKYRSDHFHTLLTVHKGSFDWLRFSPPTIQ